MTALTQGRGPEFAVRWAPKPMSPGLRDGRILGLTSIRGVYHAAERKLTQAREDAFEGHILQAYRVGVRGADDLAVRALEAEGFAPVWRSLDGVRVLALR